jgi:Cu2+-exporting ATPase
MARAETCFHCALPIPANCDIRVEIGGEQHPVCCPGCKAVATLIRDTGLERYYDSRETPDPGAVRPAEDAGEWQVFDREDMLAAFASRDGSRAEATVYVGGMYCAACSWLIDAALRKLPGIASADINPVTHRLRVTWDTSSIGLGRILATLADLGYKPQPLAPDSTERPERAEQRAALKRLLVASLGMMQVMMFAVALYSGEFQGIDADMERFLRLVSFLVTTPVVFYSARPFFAGAIRGLRARRPGMDVPVSIAIGSAYVASVYATYTNGPGIARSTAAPHWRRSCRTPRRGSLETRASRCRWHNSLQEMSRLSAPVSRSRRTAP